MSRHPTYMWRAPFSDTQKWSYSLVLLKGGSAPAHLPVNTHVREDDDHAGGHEGGEHEELLDGAAILVLQEGTTSALRIKAHSPPHPRGGQRHEEDTKCPRDKQHDSDVPRCVHVVVPHVVHNQDVPGARKYTLLYHKLGYS